MSYSDETEFVSPIDLQLVQDSDQESDDEFDQSSDSESEYYSGVINIITVLREKEVIPFPNNKF